MQQNIQYSPKIKNSMNKLTHYPTDWQTNQSTNKLTSWHIHPLTHSAIGEATNQPAAVNLLINPSYPTTYSIT